MRTELFDYHLPPEQIAQVPLPRGESRLLVLNRNDDTIAHRQFADLRAYLRPGDTLVLNDTRVTARRLQARRENELPAEVLLLRPVGERSWDALVRPGKALKPGKTVTIYDPQDESRRLTATVTDTTPEGGRILEFESAAIRDALGSWGVAPLPPYIHVPLPAAEEQRYQTVYAAQDGSAAAPTAGLHFTSEMLAEIREMGVAIATVTLHVGVGTFRPVRTENIEEHEMHSETFHLSEEAARIINATTGRVVAVGTTSMRTLESAAAFTAEQRTGTALRVLPYTGETKLFITPGFRFGVVDALITNFHLPKSTLLMLVAAFAGYEPTMQAYAAAVREGYRFFSFGDAMLII